MWCRDCALETNEKKCPVCGRITEEDIPVEILWCNDCKIPLIRTVNTQKNACPLCGGQTHHLSNDLRPVFPEERLLLEFLLDKQPYEFIQKSVWSANSRYYIDGKAIAVSTKTFQTADTDAIIQKLKQYSSGNSYQQFENYVEKFVYANKERLLTLKDEAFSFVRHAAEKFDEEKIVISFSGGKDSTVTADIVVKALSNICEWIAFLYGKMTINKLEKTFNNIFGTRITTYKLAEKLKSSGAWDRVVTDSMDAYIDSLFTPGFTEIDEEKLLQEEFL